ncbi:MAG: 2-dehydropantoate 2-reductase [Alphaproteobacteria bacterium]|nr:2-dehydropantoate 2-reductase [Alphaproteobacteria bacterium]MCB9929139.1 2-dehydropantoate 2-reductase [Alphaproteobacteria bacterium]
MARRIAVLATGANGSCIAADLTAAGLDVTLVDQWPAHVEAMRAGGLTVRTRDGETTLPVRAHHLCDLCALSPVFDVVLLACKAYDARWMAEFIKPYLAADGLLLGVQNGMTAEMLAEVVGPERTVGCVVELASQMFEPGLITRSTVREKTWFGVGAFHPSQSAKVAIAAEVIGHAGRVEVSDDILSAKWMKLIVNAMTMGLKAVLGATNAQVAEMSGVRELFLGAGAEALEAGQRLGYRVVPIFGLSADQVQNTNTLLELLLDKLTRDVGPSAINTVLQDLMKGRLSEVDLINGLVADTLQVSGRPAPVNGAITALARQIHAGALQPGPENLDRIRDLAGLA